MKLLKLNEQFEEMIREIVRDELKKEQDRNNVISVAEFCRINGISRATMWRHEKSGKAKIVRIGRKVFIDPAQFAVTNK